jgi:hypothetical protein
MPRLSPPEPSQPSPESAAETAEWLGAATALFEAIAAIELPLPDTDVLAEAYRANPPKVSVDDIREIGSALGTLASKLAADATPAETPPEGWRH